MKNLKKVLVGILVVGLVMGLLVGCNNQGEGDKGNSEPQGVEKKEDSKRLALIVSTLNNPYFVTLRDGVKQKADELGYDLIILDSQNESAKELSNVEDAMQQGVDLILINTVDSDAVANAVKLINDKDIPLISLDRGVSGGEVVTHIESDNVAGGKMAGEYIIEKLGGKGSVIQLEGIPGASSTRDRGKGFQEAIDGTDVKLIASQTADYDRQKGLDVMENLLQAHEEINAVFCQNDEMALGAIQAIESAGRADIMVVGFDAIDDAVEAVEKGKIAATVAQQPEVIGSLGVEYADRFFKGEKTPALIPVDLKLITK